MQLVEGSICEHWFQDDGVSRIHIFIDSAAQGERQQIMFQRPCAGKIIIFVCSTCKFHVYLSFPFSFGHREVSKHHVRPVPRVLTLVPRRLTEESVEGGTDVVPLVTYDFLDLKVGPQVRHLRQSGPTVWPLSAGYRGLAWSCEYP